MIQIVLAILLSIGPILICISLAAFSRRFLFDSNLNESKTTNKNNNINNNSRICTSPGCIRCNRNKQEINSAIFRFQNAGYCQNSKIYDKIEQALICAKSEETKLFFEMHFAESTDLNKPIWPIEELPNDFMQKLEILENKHQILVEECEKALQCGYLWRKNDEPQSGTNWFTFSLINQGAWQEQQCRECPKLTAILHQLDSGPLLTECLFGNVFISLLPANSAIAEHRGLTNARLRVHFGLEVPNQKGDKCFMIVGGKKFHWTAGSSTVIDDSFPHSVNSLGCPEDRIVLVLDFWHFGLNEKVKAALSRIFPPIYNKT